MKSARNWKSNLTVNLGLTMESGQPPNFIWSKEGQRYFRCVNGEKCYLWMDNNGLQCSEGFEGYVQEFLRCKDDLPSIYLAINTDGVMENAIKKYYGLRITLNDPWETLVSFICSINNNIPRIRKNVQSLMRNGVVMQPEEMLKADLKSCRLGFREKFLRGTAELMPSYDLEKIKKMQYGEAKAMLMELPGVGEKVADCVLLFGYGFLDAFPVDVNIKRAMSYYYKQKSLPEIKKFISRWGGYAGYAQQYLYCASRSMRLSQKHI